MTTTSAPQSASLPMPWDRPAGYRYIDPVTGKEMGVFREGTAGSPEIVLPIAGQTGASPAGPSATRSSSSRTGSRSSSSSAGPSSAQRKAAANLGSIAGYNAITSKRQYDEAMRNYDMSDQQNRRLADVQYDQNSGKTSAERFAAEKRLQASTGGMLSAAGNAMQGSGTRNLIDMLQGRTDLDSGEALSTLTQNQNAVRNALDEALNANAIARNDTRASTAAALRGIEADMAAQLNNIDPELFALPGSGAAGFGSDYYNRASGRHPAHVAQRAGYYMPPMRGARTANARTGNTYFDTLLGSYK